MPLSADAFASLLPPQTLELLLMLAGWSVAFLLGKELAVGYSLWRARRAEQQDPQRK